LPSSPVTDDGYGIINYIILYCIAGYLKLHYKVNKSSVFYFAMYLITSSIVFAFSLISKRAFGYIFIFNILGSIMLFLTFHQIKLKHNNIINYIAGFALSVYLIHTDLSLCNMIYQKILKFLYK